MNKEAPFHSYLQFAVETAVSAGRLTLGYFYSGVDFQNKEDGSPVTIADQRAEQYVRDQIEQRYPTHSVVGEEFGDKEPPKNSFRWFIDPIDGTRYFIRGVPLYSLLLGLEVEGRVEVGVVYFPALDMLLSAASGEGCWCNGKPAYVSQIAHLEKGIVAFSDIGNFRKYNRTKAWERIERTASYRAGWPDGYGYWMVATGRAELMIEAAVAVWDVSPYPPIFKEAGGYFGDWQGNQTIYAQQVFASNGLVYSQVRDILSKDD